MCAPRIMALLEPAHFMFTQEIIIEGFLLKNEFQYLQFCGSLSYNKKAIFDIFYKFFVVSRAKYTTKHQS